MTRAEEGNDLTTGCVWKKYIRFLLPITLGLLFQQLYNTVDAIIVGKFVGDLALAAVGGSSAIITQTVIGFFTGLNTGAAVLIAHRFGACDGEGLRRTLHTAVTFCIIIGIIISVIGILFARNFLELMGNPADIMEDSTAYLKIYFLGAVPLLLYNLCQSTLQGVGDSRRPLIYLAISCGINISLDLLFVIVFGLGVKGVGYASVISMTFCACLALSYLMRTKEAYKLNLRNLRLEKDILAQMLRIGVPSGVEASVYSISNLIIQSSVNGFGSAVVSAWTATNKLDGFYWVLTNSFGLAICSFVGQCYGAGKTERLKKAVYTAQGISLVATVAMSVILLSFARTIYSFFLSDAAIIDTAVEIMWYFVPFYFIWSFVDVLSGTFRGAGDTLRPMIISVMTTCVFRVIWMLFVVPHWHSLQGVCVVYVITWLMTVICFIIYFFKAKWLKIDDSKSKAP